MDQYNDNSKPRMCMLEKVIRFLLFLFLTFFAIKFVSNNNDYDIMIIVLAVSVVYVFMNLFYPIVILK